MRRLLGLAVLFAVLSACVPSYGYILVYNVSSTVNGADDATNAKVTIPLKGHLVLNISDDYDTIVDANLILYGKDAGKNKVYVQLNYSGSGELVGLDLRHIGNYIFVGFGSGSPYRLEMLMSGKTTLKDIGYGKNDKKLVASSIKGVNPVWGGFLLGPNSDQDVSGTANASATLNTRITMTVNKDEWTQDEIVDELVIILQGKGYDAAVVPVPDDSYSGVGISATATNGSGGYGLYAWGDISTGEINGEITATANSVGAYGLFSSADLEIGIIPTEVDVNVIGP